MAPKRKAAEASAAASAKLAPQPKKSKFSVQPKYFLDNAQTLQAVLSGDSELAKLDCKPKKFSSSSLGWSGSSRTKIPVKVKDDESQEMEAQITFNVTLVGSKEATATETAEEKKDDKEEAEAAEAEAEDKPNGEAAPGAEE